MPTTNTELIEINKQKALKNNGKAEFGIGIVSSANNVAIFSLFFTSTLRTFLTEFGQFIFFPATAALSIIQMGLAIRAAHLDGKKSSILKAAIETVSAVGLTTVVVGGIAAAAVFSAVTPIVFAAVVGLRVAYHAVSSIYYGIKSVLTNDTTKKQAYQEQAKAHAVGTLASSLALVGIVGVLMLGKYLLGALAIGANILGLGYGIYKAVTAKPTPPATNHYRPLVSNDEPTLSADKTNDLSTTAKLASVVGLSRSAPSSPVSSHKTISKTTTNLNYPTRSNANQSASDNRSWLRKTI
ncbi:MAG: hypothetical protein ACD_21C00155G0002 [uncultured bacterium]|nr:MAG: hypothetical protein ACD_21C00155G0002 [uncultured bacterium]